MANPAAAPVSHKQPRGLYVLFSTEAFERFSYYGMRALLVLYLVNQLKFERADALAVYGVYTGLVYLTPLLGGYLADNILGARKAILIGGIVMGLGEMALAFSAGISDPELAKNILYMGLGVLIVGNGFFKPNISTIVGGLYSEDDPRRDGGFTIFYMGINLGAMFSPLVAGSLGEGVAWWLGFFAAGVGMVLGVGVFMWGQGKIGLTGFPPGREVDENTRLLGRDWRDILLWSLGSVLLVAATIWLLDTMGTMPVAGIGLLGFVGAEYLRRRRIPAADVAKREKLTAEEIHRLVVIGIIAFFNIFFWMGFEQAGGTMNLFADNRTDRLILGWEMPASWFQMINPLFIVGLAPIFSAMWKRWDESRFKLSTPAKMGWGMILLGAGFLVMVLAEGRADAIGLVTPLWLITVYFIHTCGELFLSPIGLSMITKLSPARMVALMMGVWFGSTAIANYLAGMLESILHNYDIPLFPFLVASSTGAGVVLLLATPLLKKWMHGRG